MRVLHLVKTTRGAVWALRQIAALRALGVDVVVALPSTQTGLAPEYARTGATVVCADVDFVLGPRLRASLRRCRALVERVQPDLIHSHFVGTTLVARLALGRAHPVPRIFQVPGPLHLEHALTRRLELATAGPKDHWIGTCRWTYEEYLRLGVPRERAFIAYYGTALERGARADDRWRIRREFGVAADVPFLGMVAYVYAPRRLFGERRGLKGHEDFIDAVDALKSRGLPARALVVGSAWIGAEAYERRLRAYAWRRGGQAIRFTGHRSDVPALYAGLDVAVHPSLSENCGAAVESLAAACPTVASNVGGLPDVVVDGETGWLVPPGDPARLADAIAEALADPAEAKRRARAGQTLVRGLFSIERTAADVEMIYRAILRTPKREHRMAV